ERCEGASGARLRMARGFVWWQYDAADGGPEPVTRGADSVVASGVRVHQTQTAPEPPVPAGGYGAGGGGCSAAGRLRGCREIVRLPGGYGTTGAGWFAAEPQPG